MNLQERSEVAFWGVYHEDILRQMTNFPHFNLTRFYEITASSKSDIKIIRAGV
jgi:hypothetical protein